MKMITPMTTTRVTSDPPMPPPRVAMRFPDVGASVSVIAMI